MSHKIYQVDAFTNKAYGGNAAGVVPDASGLSDVQMLKIAQEMSLSETAFVFPGQEEYDFEVRFFTPSEEVDLCGHATIATFSLLKSLGMITKKDVIQKTKAGLLPVQLLEDGAVIMRQAEPVMVEREIPMVELLDSMCIKEEAIGIDGVMMLPEIWSTGLKDILLPIKSVDLLKEMAPDMAKLSGLSQRLDVIGLHAFTIDDKGQVFCRNFAPVCGIPEESATGTSNGALGACLHAKGYLNTTDLQLKVTQGQWMGRPSEIFVQAKGQGIAEIWVGGKAAIVLEGIIATP